MRKGLIALILTLSSFATFAQSQDSNITAEKRAENQTKTMTERLDLSEEQQKQVYALNLARVQKMQELRDSQTRDRSQMRASMETFNTEIAKILTVEQQEKYKTMLEDRRNNGGRGPGSEQPAKP